MKTIKLILLIATVSILSQACRKGSIWGIYGKGAKVTQTRSLTGYSSINLNCDGNISYVQDSVYKLEITAQENILSVLESKLVDTELKLSFLREVRSHEEINIVIHSPKLSAITISGSGNFRAANTVTTSNIGVYLSGSGSIAITKLNSTNIDSKISGSGDISIEGGTGKTSTYNISGSGNVYASGMECTNAILKISGSGNVSINATNTLDITLSGSGDIRYKGNPTISSNITGSGKLIRIN